MAVAVVQADFLSDIARFHPVPGVGACGAGCDTIAANATLTTHTVLVGFAYKFGGPFVVQ